MKNKVVNELNEFILKDYGITLNEISDKIKDENVLAFYSLEDDTININQYNKNIFNDYIAFIETMIHENIHKINFKKGLKDVDIEDDMQIHNEIFRNAMRDEYEIYCDNKTYTGGADMQEPRNEKAFNRILSLKMKHKRDFLRIQEIYYSKVYEPLKKEYQKEENKYKDNKGRYVIDEKGGIEIWKKDF